MFEQEVDIISTQQAPTRHLLGPDPVKGWAFGDEHGPILAIWELGAHGLVWETRWMAQPFSVMGNMEGKLGVH